MGKISYLCHEIKTLEDMTRNASSTAEVLGRTELAQRYFPFLQPHSAWQKLRSLLADDPATRPLTELRRRSFMPAELDRIYQLLGRP